VSGAVDLVAFVGTRIVELVVHTDDLAVSVGVEPPEPSEGAASVALAAMLAAARSNSGDLAVLRALARRERATTSPFLVF
jgi:hypothetical protein